MKLIWMIMIVAPLIVTACGHKELIAPCSLRETHKPLHTVGLAFAAQDMQQSAPFADMKLRHSDDRCGPLKPINSFIAKTNGASDG